MSATNVPATLRAAADLLERDGWCQGAYHVGSRRCATQAIYDVMGDHWAVITLEEYVGGRNVEWWNDEPGRTAADVIAAMRAAADADERGHQN